jgi:hypothetical protein
VSVGVASLPVAAVLSGCVPTQTIAARARLVEARIRASQSAVKVARPTRLVAVESVGVLRTAGAATIVVRLVNRSASTLTGLPVSLVLRPAGAPVRYLNASAGLDYFETHVAVLPGRGSTVWVMPAGRGVPVGARVSAVVGAPAGVERAATALPRIAVSEVGRADRGRDRSVEVAVRSRSPIPQDDLPVYAIGTRNGRVVAAGRAAVAHLGSYGSTHVRVELGGAVGRASVRVFAVPTIFN